jgi:7-cyano-7-deazaguanine synthase
MNKAVIILSGGLDSTTLLYDLYARGKDVHAISFDYGQRHSKEIEMAKKTCGKVGVEHTIIDLSNLGGILSNSALTGDIDVPEGHYADPTMQLTVVPNRNMIMLSIAIGHAINIGAKDVYYGAHAGDHAIYPDCRPGFVHTIQQVAELCHYDPVYVHAPYLYMGKDKIVARGLSLGVDFTTTWTCYKGKEKACGKCGSCTERLEAFDLNNAKDPIEYEED